MSRIVACPKISATINSVSTPFGEVDLLDGKPFDLNGDGFDDLIVQGTFFRNQTPAPDQEGVILINDQNGGFTPAQGDRPLNVAPRKVVVADFNGDGALDIFIGDQGHDFNPFPGRPNQLLLANGRGGYVDASDRLPDFNDFTHGAAAGDIDGDGDLDLYVGNISGAENIDPYFLINDGAANFTVNREILPTSVATGITRFEDKFLSAALIDIDGDGAVDLVLGSDEVNGRSDTKVFFNDGADGFSDERQVTTPLNGVDGVRYALTQDIGAVDINRDGLTDLVLLQTQVNYEGWALQVLVQTANGGFVDQTTSRILTASSSAEEEWTPFLRIADVNNDGRDDVIVEEGSNGSRPIVLLDKGSNAFVGVSGAEYAAKNDLFNSGGVVAPYFDGGDLGFVETFFFEGERFTVTAAQEGLPQLVEAGERSSDALRGSGREDLMFGGRGNDTLNGLRGDDTLDGGKGNDVLIGKGGADVLLGGTGRDDIAGGGGGDVIRGGRSRDDLAGGGGADLIEGEGGGDTLSGGGGADTLAGGRGKDVLKGGGGDDVFVFGKRDSKDQIEDFEQGRDLIRIDFGAEGFADLTIAQEGADVTIAFSNILVTVEDQSAADFTAAGFLF